MNIEEILTDKVTCDLESREEDFGFRLVASFCFGLKSDPEGVIYCADYHYNGNGRLHEESGWTLDHICRYEGSEEDKITPTNMNKRLRRDGLRLFDIFYWAVLRKLKESYPPPN